MSNFVPASKHLLNRRTSSGWDSHAVCKTLVLWYPELLRPGKIHSDMRESRKAIEFLGCLQEYPADLQDILILLAQRYGIQRATLALDNAVRRCLEHQAPRKSDAAGELTAEDSERLTA